MNHNACMTDCQYPVDDLFRWGKVIEMDEPKTAGQMLDYLKARYDTAELQAISHAAHISRTTLDSWAARPEAPMRKIGRDHYRRIFSAAEANPPPDLAAIDARLARIEQRLDSLLTLRAEPDRISQMVRSRARAKAGGAA
jgi:hypothetical protein